MHQWFLKHLSKENKLNCFSLENLVLARNITWYRNKLFSTCILGVTYILRTPSQSQKTGCWPILEDTLILRSKCLPVSFRLWHLNLLFVMWSRLHLKYKYRVAQIKVITSMYDPPSRFWNNLWNTSTLAFRGEQTLK